MKSWVQKTIDTHIKTSQLVYDVHLAAFDFIRNNPTTNEYTVQQFIHEEFNKRNLVSHAPQIVAFGPSGAEPHYTPTPKKSKKLTPNTSILLDLWARLKTNGSPFTDMTWMGFHGKPTKQFNNAFKVLFKARDTGVNYVKKNLQNLPSGKAIDDATKKVLIDNGYKAHIKHSTGHPLGFASPHGRGRNINQTNPYPILKNVPYTIEPGIYIDGKFGIRSEIDFMVTKNNEFMFTSPVQKKLISV